MKKWQAAQELLRLITYFPFPTSFAPSLLFTLGSCQDNSWLGKRGRASWSFPSMVMIMVVQSQLLLHTDFRFILVFPTSVVSPSNPNHFFISLDSFPFKLSFFFPSRRKKRNRVLVVVTSFGVEYRALCTQCPYGNNNNNNICDVRVYLFFPFWWALSVIFPDEKGRINRSLSTHDFDADGTGPDVSIYTLAAFCTATHSASLAAVCKKLIYKQQM